MYTLSIKRKIGDNIIVTEPIETDRTCYKTFEEAKERLRALMIGGKFITVNHCSASRINTSDKIKLVDSLLDDSRCYVHLNRNGKQIFTRTSTLAILLIDNVMNDITIPMIEEFSIVELDIPEEEI